MTRWTVAAAAALVCAAALVWAPWPAGAAASKSATAAKMYLEEMVVGTILATGRMYTGDEVTWYRSELRVDAVESKQSMLTAGQMLKMKHQVARALSPLQRPGVGDQVRAKLRPPEEAAGIVWTAESVEMLGRGELVNPGDGAAIDMGSPRARVLVKLFAPLGVECHQKTVELVRELAERDGERVRVQAFDMASAAGRQEMQRERLRCATVLVNNRMKFMLEGEDGAREVVFSKPPNEARSSYNSEDVVTVVLREIARLYPEEVGAEGETSAP